MILVDSSVWIDHFRRNNRRLAELLEHDQVLTHPAVIGELACGNLKSRETVLRDLKSLPSVTIAGDDEALHMIEAHRLSRKGIGWIDALLIASALLTGCRLWTMDARLAKVWATVQPNS